MIFFSLIINIAVFFLLLNFSYFNKRRRDSDYPEKSLSRMILFPLVLGTVFTIIVDGFRGVVMYQLLLFIVVALLLYVVFYVVNKN